MLGPLQLENEALEVGQDEILELHLDLDPVLGISGWNSAEASTA